MSGWAFEYTLDVDLDNRIIYEKIYGVWRVATAKAYIQDFQDEVKQLTKKPWARMVDLSNWKIAYPEVIEIMGSHFDWCRQHSLQWSVNVINNPTTYGQLVRMANSGKVSEYTRTFRTQFEADKFLKEQKYNLRYSPSESWVFKSKND